MYHGIILDKSFQESNFPQSFELFAARKSTSNSWTIFGIVIEDAKLKKTIQLIQTKLRSDIPFYAHLYNDQKLIIVLKKKIFRVTPHRSTWDKAINYGKSLGIPEQQLDIWPNRFQDEMHYFAAADFK